MAWSSDERQKNAGAEWTQEVPGRNKRQNPRAIAFDMIIPATAEAQASNAGLAVPGLHLGHPLRSSFRGNDKTNYRCCLD